MKEFSVKVSVRKYSPGNIRYSAYSVTDAAHVFLSFAGDKVAVEMTPKKGFKAAEIKKRFLQELEDEKLRERLFEENRELREFLILKAMNEPRAEEKTGEDGLTPEQRKELDEMIRQVEEELESEEKSEKKDSRGIMKTWEEKHAGENKK